MLDGKMGSRFDECATQYCLFVYLLTMLLYTYIKHFTPFILKLNSIITDKFGYVMSNPNLVREEVRYNILHIMPLLGMYAIHFSLSPYMAILLNTGKVCTLQHIFLV